MKIIVLSCLCLLSFNVLYSQHVPTLKPTTEKLTKVKPAAADFFEKGNENFKQKDFASAKINFQKAIETDTSFAEAYINLSKVNEAEDNLETAKSVMEDGINSMVPLNARAFEQLGRVNYKLNDFEAAAYNFRQAVSLDPENNDYQYFSGVALLGNQEAGLSESYMRKAVELKSSLRNKIGLSNTQIIQGKFQDGIATIKSAEAYEKSSEACLNLAIANHSLGNSEETTKYMELAKANGASSQPAFHNLSGLIQSDEMENEGALVSFNKAIEMSSDNWTYYNDRASHLIRTENFKDALTDLDKALELKPDFSKAYYNRGIVKEMLRDEEGACLDWEYAFFLGYQKAEELLNNPICN